MPFTVSHIAAVLPGRVVNRLPLAGLAVGAMSPDLEYVVHGMTKRTIGHTPAGIVLLDLPLSLATLAAAAIAVPGLAPLIPKRWPNIAQRVRDWRPAPMTISGIYWLIVAVLLGATNHVVLDAFTHRGAWGPDNFQRLDTYVDIAGRTMHLTKFLQYGLSVAGLMVLAAMAVRWFARVEPRRAARARAPWLDRTQMVPITLIGLIISVASLEHLLTTVERPGLNRTTGVILILGTWRAAALVLLAMGALTRGLSLLRLSPVRS